MHKIVVVGLDGCLGSAFLGLIDMLSLAQRAIASAIAPSLALGASDPEGEFSLVSASPTGGPFRTNSGLSIEVETSLEEITACDAIIVPCFAPDASGKTPDMSPLAPVAAWLRRHHARGALIGGCGSGVFLLGEAGLLDGRRCTTSWWHHEELLNRYPRADAARG
jgi:transcriptional regulator GlxA family with amidase domain